MKPLTNIQAKLVYDVLVDLVDAPERQRDMFYHTQINSVCEEYRFQGALGFGGKFRRAYWPWSGERWYVDQYREDESPATKAMIEEANAVLAELVRGTNEDN